MINQQFSKTTGKARPIVAHVLLLRCVTSLAAVWRDKQHFCGVVSRGEAPMILTVEESSHAWIEALLGHDGRGRVVLGLEEGGETSVITRVDSYDPVSSFVLDHSSVICTRQ